nr:unnamed protein product [Callosobruchus analis]
MSSNTEVLLYGAAAAAVCIIASSVLLKKQKPQRRTWSRRWLQRRGEGRDVLNMLNNELRFPKTVTDWQQIADDYWNLWQFPHCLGALDGKHIAFRAPISDGSFYYNYKGGHSIVLLGLVDARYRFIYVNIGVNGRHSDGGVFSRSNLAYAIVILWVEA